MVSGQRPQGFATFDLTSAPCAAIRSSAPRTGRLAHRRQCADHALGHPPPDRSASFNLGSSRPGTSSTWSAAVDIFLPRTPTDCSASYAAAGVQLTEQAHMRENVAADGSTA